MDLDLFRIYIRVCTSKSQISCFQLSTARCTVPCATCPDTAISHLAWPQRNAVLEMELLTHWGLGIWICTRAHRSQ
eukprot:scaffold322547_cov31-Tisochrysis_lutea.AAC.1